MNSQDPTEPRVRSQLPALSAAQVFQYEVAGSGACHDVAAQAFESLQRPDDFPPLDAAIVSGDRVALAVDPNVPEIIEVLRGVLNAIAKTDAGRVDIVLGDEADDELVASIGRELGSGASVTRHDSEDRELLRYLGPDEAANPIYLSRGLVDADLVLPINASRPFDRGEGHDLTGIFPTFADSATRIRHRESLIVTDDETPPTTIDWLLGVQLLVSVSVNGDGDVASVSAGTPEAIGKSLPSYRRGPDAMPPSSPLVVASLDGNSQQQSWENVARAAVAASRFVAPGGTIVLWTEIDQSPFGALLSIGDGVGPAPDDEPRGEDEFPAWDKAIAPSRALATLADEHRLMLHADLPAEAIESMGIGAIESSEELSRLSQSFETCGLLRAAQFAGSSMISLRPPSA